LLLQQRDAVTLSEHNKNNLKRIILVVIIIITTTTTTIKIKFKILVKQLLSFISHRRNIITLQPYVTKQK
jgi:hypothetical protein